MAPTLDFLSFHPKNTVFTMSNHFVLKTGFSLRFCPQNLLWHKQTLNKTRPTYPYLFGHVTGNKHLCFRPNDLETYDRHYFVMSYSYQIHKDPILSHSSLYVKHTFPKFQTDPNILIVSVRTNHLTASHL